MNAEETQAKHLIKQHLSENAPSYQELIQLGYNGFMEYYLLSSKNSVTMSTTAEYIVTMKLAKIDKLRDNKKRNLLVI